MSTSTSPPITISKQTLMPLGVVAGVGILLASAGWSAASQLSSLRHEVEMNRLTIEATRVTIERAAGDRWTRSDMRLWVSEHRAANPGVKVPDVPGR